MTEDADIMKPIRPHPDHHELHGITLAVDTRESGLYVGRCHTIDDTRIYLVDVAVHQESSKGQSKRAYLQRVAKFGHYKQHDRMSVLLRDVAWFETLGKIASDGPPAICQ